MFMKFWSSVGAMCSVCLMSSRLSFSAVDTDASLSDVVPSDSRLSATKLRDVADDVGQRGDRVADLVRIVGQQAGHRGQVLVQLSHQVAAGLQCRHENRQVLHRAEEVVAVVAERRNRLGQLHDGVADGDSLAAQVVRGGGHERSEGADAAGGWAAASRSSFSRS